jgi:hypothetical protein
MPAIDMHNPKKQQGIRPKKDMEAQQAFEGYQKWVKT